jgi:NAD(P)-dependent dehydrogenase (short-subunit alcohol dehydrogenase family)
MRQLTILVTGCSSGFGELMARTLAAHGHHVYASIRGMAGRNSEATERLRAWAAKSQFSLSVIELDVTDDASVRVAVNQILAAEGTLDVVVNNAGAAAAGPLEAFSAPQMAGLLDTNVIGPMRVNKAVLPAMRARRSGLIIWVTSTLGRVLPSIGGLYPATKWAAEGFAESLHYELRPFGIDVAILEPGSFPTPAISKSMVAAERAVAAEYRAVTPARRQVRPDGAYRLPDAQEVADAVLHLVELPSGHRPLRTVVGPIFTEGVAEYNQTYERVRARLVESLGRPDQAIPWASEAPRV